ncbi:uncharacterized protein LOC128882797 [Hylaeus volcanicus]|uniref:uncharacterized protein LOC128882797 n=1 Tax=Hylaeus volcanicus TaxID=313075 RepID=UPI0023B7A19D|nr:uncharacterized protein LOC128882797 [Hylaeus volcanicus]
MREKTYPTTQVKIEDLMHSEFPTTIENDFILQPKSCREKSTEIETAECTGTKFTKISEIGLFMVLEIYDTYNNNSDIELDKIPKNMKCSFLAKSYILRRVIIFKLPAHTRKFDKNTVGHFTAVVFHNNT